MNRQCGNVWFDVTETFLCYASAVAEKHGGFPSLCCLFEPRSTWLCRYYVLKPKTVNRKEEMSIKNTAWTRTSNPPNSPCAPAGERQQGWAGVARVWRRILAVSVDTLVWSQFQRNAQFLSGRLNQPSYIDSLPFLYHTGTQLAELDLALDA